MKKATKIALGATAVVGAAVAGAIYANWNAFVPIAAMGINYLRYLNAPNGELTVETVQGFDGSKTAAAPRSLRRKTVSGQAITRRSRPTASPP
jgi:alcohol dehydrogenase (cytochrome c)